MSNGTKIFNLSFFTVMPSPYQRELFRALVGSGSFAIQVYYYAYTVRDRQWRREELDPFEAVLRGSTLHALGGSTQFNPDIIKVLMHSTADLFVISDYSAPTAQVAMRYLNALRRPWVFWGEIPGLNRRGRLGSFVRSWLQKPLNHASGIAAIGSRAVEAYQTAFPNLPIFNIPYFCDLAPYKAAAAQRYKYKSSSTLNVLFSGQLIKRKGVDILLEAFEKLAHVLPEMRLVLLGDGPERAALSRRVPPLLRERVLFLGFYHPPDIPKIFAAADLFVLPSRHDGWGVVVNEALGAGLPIIASDRVGAAQDLVAHGRNGLITPAGHAGALAEAIMTLASSACLRRAFGRASRERADQWGLDEAVSRWLHLCHSLVEADALEANSD